MSDRLGKYFETAPKPNSEGEVDAGVSQISPDDDRMPDPTENPDAEAMGSSSVKGKQDAGSGGEVLG